MTTAGRGPSIRADRRARADAALIGSSGLGGGGRHRRRANFFTPTSSPSLRQPAALARWRPTHRKRHRRPRTASRPRRASSARTPVRRCRWP
ncbi:MAG: hypothetical protein MZV64_44280 [Ignavibacteriales bacterium]|nr:hypothetical protein [Ignavibacteriales bacterium]